MRYFKFFIFSCSKKDDSSEDREESSLSLLFISHVLLVM